MTRLALAAVCVVLTALLAGCGSSGSTGSTTSPPLTKTAYLEQVSEIVTDVQDEHGSVTIDPAKVSEGDVAPVDTALRDLADRLEAVSPPAEVQGLHGDFVAALRALADELPALTSKTASDPAKGLDVLLESEPMQALLRVSQGFTAKGYDVALDGS